MEKGPISAITNAHLRPGRPTIGVLMVKATYTWALSVWAGMLEAAREQDVNLIYFPGGRLLDPEGFEAQANIIYSLVSAARLDGLVIWTSVPGEANIV
jgi:ABC-type sugar transport system substrate-binding protein